MITVLWTKGAVKKNTTRKETNVIGRHVLQLTMDDHRNPMEILLVHRITTKPKSIALTLKEQFTLCSQTF